MREAGIPRRGCSRGGMNEYDGRSRTARIRVPESDAREIRVGLACRSLGRCRRETDGRESHDGYEDRAIQPDSYLMCFVDFSFSLQMNSIISWSTMMRWFTRTVNGFVYALGSSIVMSISIVPKFGRRNRSVILSCSVYGLPLTSSHPARSSPRKFVVSTTSVSPSHQPRE